MSSFLASVDATRSYPDCQAKAMYSVWRWGNQLMISGLRKCFPSMELEIPQLLITQERRLCIELLRRLGLPDHAYAAILTQLLSTTYHIDIDNCLERTMKALLMAPSLAAVAI
ncbi:hypothetical protein Nepgr_032650 [Nepenthes gracilis]|uniref:Uncharacterized protein n=1 Tax=Nepenthes gracilis TaxID=150966 RepID=A0AAD3Y5X4_NEPGR|nr:hypothetical protein Nepgr_032650 [Nepenthes gracilis]